MSNKNREIVKSNRDIVVDIKKLQISNDKTAKMKAS